ncbi:hypothetical protein TNCV_1223361 [Trichonephila clavipes]|nr:hypothetical protein TNCV_1223361 [Trichonephila clavipes]
MSILALGPGWALHRSRSTGGPPNILEGTPEDFSNNDPSIYQEEVRCFPFQTGIHYRRKTDFFPEEDTTMSYSGFEPESTRLQAEGHSHHTGWTTMT